MIVKAITHLHSEWSYDGAWNLSKITRIFGRLGYGLILTTEHDLTFDNKRWKEYKKACYEESTKKILIIPGIEYSDGKNNIHVMVWGVSEFLGNNQIIVDILNKVKKQNGICVLAHPSRRKAWQVLNKEWMPLFDGIELWNRKFDGIAPSREANDLLKSYSKAIPFVGMDFHRVNQLFPLSMMIQVDGTLSVDNVIHALRNGNSYPIALGISALRFTEGFLSYSVTCAEFIRRITAKFIKSKILK
jgi:hypothetical protein